MSGGELDPPRDWDAAYGAYDQAGASTRTCHDCPGTVRVQAGDWGWKAHRFYLHGEGEDPGHHPAPAQERRDDLPPPWTDQQRADFHARNRARRHRARHQPPPGPGGPPPRAGAG